MDYMLDWDDPQGDQFSFEDSDRFEEDSLCSWVSEAESVCNNNWRGWKKSSSGPPVAGPTASLGSLVGSSTTQNSSSEVLPLVEITAKTVALHIPFEVVEKVYPPVPENLQLRIAYWSFPENEEDIRLYSCLANGSPDEFQKGEHMVKSKAVKEVLQIGFHLSGTVVPTQAMTQQGTFNVAITFDRRRISTCSCTCSSASKWCCHVVALCLYRIHYPNLVCLRAPVSESLSRLHRDQLQKFAQYLISELPRQILPTAQRLLDELLSSQASAINTVCGAPDPTAGPSATEQTRWFLDENILHENIKKTLVRFTGPSPIVFSDVNSLYLSSSAPQAAAEWTNLLRPLRGREPEGIWNLLSIVREMYRRRDTNAISLLKILTEECILCDQIVIWWFNTRTSALHSHHGNHGHRANSNSSTMAAQHACASMLDEVVTLWRLAALDPAISPHEQDEIEAELRKWHLAVIDKVRKGRGSNYGAGGGGGNNVRKVDVEIFAGFKPGIEACLMDWLDFPIEGVTYSNQKKSTETIIGATPVRTPSMKAGAIPKAVSVAGCSNSSQPVCEEAECSSTSAGCQASTSKQGDESNKAESNVTNGSVHQTSPLPYEKEDSSDNTRTKDSSSEKLHRLSSSESISSGTDGHDLQRSEGTSRSEDTDSDDIQGEQASGTLPVTDSRGLPSEEVDQGEAAAGVTAAAVAGSKCEAVKGDGKCAEGKPSGKRKVKTKHLLERVDSDSADNEAVPSNRPVAEADSDSSNDAVPGAAVVEGAKAKPQNEAQQSSDEYQVYFYDTKAKLPEHNQKKRSDVPNPFAGIKRMEDRIEIMFSRAEALHAHGYTKHACQLAIQLAEEMLANPPALDVPPAQNLSNRARKKHIHQQSTLASMTLAKAAFLCSVLSEQVECHDLAFKMGLFGLEIPRQPASTKALEVKLANQEIDLVALLKRIPLGPPMLSAIRERGDQLRNGTMRCRGDALLPLSLASYIFDALCMPGTHQWLQVIPGLLLNHAQIASLNRQQTRSALSRERHPTEEKLGFEAAVGALALKANVSESDHALLCEGTRRQRGDLATTLLVTYKDDQPKLRKILDALLDKQGPKTHKTPCSIASSCPSSSQTSRDSSVGTPPHPDELQSNKDSSSPRSNASPPSSEMAQLDLNQQQDKDRTSGYASGNSSATLVHGGSGKSGPSRPGGYTTPSPTGSTGSNERHSDKGSPDNVARPPELVTPGWSEDAPGRPGGASSGAAGGSSDGAGAAGNGRLLPGPDIDRWRETHQPHQPSITTGGYWGRMIGRHPRKSKGMASIDSSAPETTSSDNSPTLGRRVPPGGWGRYHGHGPGSDSGSSGNSSDSISSSSSAERGPAVADPAVSREATESPGQGAALMRVNPTAAANVGGEESRSSTPSSKGNRRGKKGRNDNCPTVPNQPSEASAHFFFELAKTILTKAGGNSSTSLFTQASANANHTGPHRGLHLCAFEIGLYALRLHNAVTPNWLSRTYSSHVSWITGQAMEIGSAAVTLLVDTWEGHLTPAEAASLADRASRGRDPNMVKAAAELALSCLRHAHALNPTEVNRALMQCKEQDNPMLEKACLAVESAGKRGDVYPDVLFNVARQWEWLHDNVFGNRSTHHSHVAESNGEAQVSQNSPTTEGNQVVPYSCSMNTVSVANSVGHPVMMPYAAAPRVPHTIPLPVYHAGYQDYIPVEHYMAGNGQPGFHGYAAAPVNGGHGPIPLPGPGRRPVTHRQSLPPNSHGMHWNLPHQCPPYHAACPYNPNAPSPGVALPIRPLPAQGVPLPHAPMGQYPRALPPTAVHRAMPPVVAQASSPSLPHMAQPVQQQQQQPPGLFYLDAAYRVGMLAVDTLARRVHDERTQSRFSPNPPYGEEIKWLLEISKRLGASYLQQFCACVLNVVVSPFVLHTIAWEAAHHLATANHTPIQGNLRSPVLSPIVQKCVQMYIQCIHQRMYHITPPEYDDFINVVQSAQKAFMMAPGGMTQFNDFLQSLRRLRPCKRDLWARLASSLSPGNIFEHSTATSH